MKLPNLEKAKIRTNSKTKPKRLSILQVISLLVKNILLELMAVR